MTDQPPLTATHGVTRTVPDPSKLTTAQLLREIANLNDRMESTFTQRGETYEAKFDGIAREFTLIEARRQEQKSDTEKALVNALSAAKEAVKEQNAATEKSNTKTETSAADQSRQQFTTFTATIKGVTDTLSDVKDRVNKIENVRLGSMETRDTQRLDLGVILGVLSLAAVIIFALLK